MDRLDCDRLFVAVVEAGSFTKAAHRCGISPAQASKLVAKLEAVLAVRLVQRTTRKLSLTEEGRGYFEQIRGLLGEFDALDAAMREASTEPAGRLKLTAPLSFGKMRLAPLLLDFARKHPKIALEVNFSDRIVNLVEEGFDAAIRIGNSADSSLIARKIAVIGISVVASPNYLAGASALNTPDDLADHACIIDSNFRTPLQWHFSKPKTKISFAVNVRGRLIFSSAETCVLAACQDFGVARVPSFISTPFIERGALVRLFDAYSEPELPVHILYPPARHLTRKLRLLVQHLVQAFKS